MDDIYYLKGNRSKCFHDQSQDGAINLPKRDETTYRPDLLSLIGTGTGPDSGSLIFGGTCAEKDYNAKHTG